MKARVRMRLSIGPSLPFAAVLAFAALPLLFLVLAAGVTTLPTLDVSSLAPALAFAGIGAAVSSVVGGAIGALAGTLETPGRKWTVGLSVALVAAPPAFWWIGVTRLPVELGSLHGLASGSAVAGLALAPVTLLLVLAASREIPTSAYDAARVALGPVHRLAFVLFPLVRPAIIAGFLLTSVLLLGESEIPFLFGFRTSMTDVVTRFSQTFDAVSTVPIILPMIATVLALGLLMLRPLFAVMLPASGSGRGVARKPAGLLVGLAMLLLPLLVALSLAGYAWATYFTAASLGRRSPAVGSTIVISIAEPVLCALASVALIVLAVYPLRRAPVIRSLTMIAWLLFCVPAAIVAIGWVAFGQAVGGISIVPAVAHISRMIGLPALGLMASYSRLPPSLDDAARLMSLSPIRRAWTLTLPLLAPSLAASAALTAALIFADRDVASLLLAPGASRVMLNLYLLSANAPSAVIGASALMAFATGAVVIVLAGGGPLVLWLRRRG